MDGDKPSDERLLEIAGDLADGRRIDHLSVDSEGCDETLDALTRLQRVSRIFSEGRQEFATDEEIPFGGTWGRLRLKTEVGRGSFGRVFRAADPVLDRDVALKLLHIRDRGAQLNFLAEARRMARIRHPHVLAVYGADLHHQAAGFWSDLLEGQTLEERLAGKPPLNWGEKIAIMVETAEALAAVHRAGIIHGDVKASNIMLDREKGAILMDFGAGHISGQAGSPAGQGTPLSAAPEILFDGISTPASDLWALGVLLFRVAADGGYPFPAEDFEQLKGMLADPAPEMLPTSTPRAFRKLVAALLSRSSDQRPGAEDVVEELKSIQRAPARRIRRMLRALVVSILLVIAAAALVQTRLSRKAEEKIRREKNIATEITSLLEDMLAAASPVYRGRDVRVLSLLDEAAETLRDNRIRDPAAALGLRTTLGRSYLALGEIEKARRVMTVKRNVGTYPMWILFDADLAGAELLEKEGRQREALEAALRVRNQLPDGSDWNVLRNRSSILIAGLELELGHLIRAEEEIRALIARAPPGSPTLARANLILGGLRSRQSRFDEAETALRDAENLYLSLNPRVNTNVLAARVQLASTIAQAGDLRRARTLLSELLPLCEHQFGPNNPDTAAVRSNLATVLQELGDYEKARVLYEKGLEILLASESPDRMRIAMIRGNIANLLKLLGKTGEAEAGYLELIEDLEVEMGAAHPLTLLNQNNLAELYLENGRYQNSLGLVNRALPRAREVLGDDNQITLELQENRGRSLVASGRPEEGLQLLQAVLARKIRVLGVDNPYTLNTRVRIGEAFEKLDRRSEAIVSYRQAFEGRRRVLGPTHAETCAAKRKYEAIKKGVAPGGS